MWRRLNGVDADLLHIYFGHMAVYWRPFFAKCPRPIVVSFHGADAGVDLEKRAHAAAMREVFRDATLLLTLAPGAYTAHLTGAANTTGVGLIELYAVP